MVLDAAGITAAKTSAAAQVTSCSSL